MTAVTRPSSPRRSVLEQLSAEKARKLIEPMLKPGVTLERVLAEVYFAVQKNPALSECTGESLIMAVAQCVAWDLAIGEKAHLVPFNVKVKDQSAPNGERWEHRAQAVRDYKGDIDLVVRCGAARYVDAQNVYANEHFEYEQGTAPFIRHRPIMDPRSRGELIGSYAVARVNATDIKIHVMSVDEIEQVRKRFSKQWKEGALPVWYGPKTCVHRVTKTLPSSPKLDAVLARFAEEERLIAASVEGAALPTPATPALKAGEPIEGTSTVVASEDPDEVAG